MADKGGRPKLTPEQKEEKKRELLGKLEPYLKTGLSINKALGEAQIGDGTFYDLLKEDEGFRKRINTFRNFIPILANNIVINELMQISGKQNPQKGRPRQKLTKEDKDFLWKFVLNSSLTKEEFGERKKVELVDPEAEVQKIRAMLEEETTEDVDHGNE